MPPEIGQHSSRTGPPIRDDLRGIVFDESDVGYVLFVRSRPAALVQAIRPMAQSLDDRLFRIRTVEPTIHEEFSITLEASDRTRSGIALTSVVESSAGSLVNLLGLVSLLNKMPIQLSDFMPDDYWQHLAPSTVEHFLATLSAANQTTALGGDRAPFASDPPVHASAKTTDRPYCIFVEQGRFLLALFVREIDDAVATQCFAMVADAWNRVYLLTRFETTNPPEPEMILRVCRDDGEELTLKVPLRQLKVGDDQKLSTFSMLDCVRYAGLQRTLSYPDELFIPTRIAQCY